MSVFTRCDLCGDEITVGVQTPRILSGTEPGGAEGLSWRLVQPVRGEFHPLGGRALDLDQKCVDRVSLAIYNEVINITVPAASSAAQETP